MKSINSLLSQSTLSLCSLCSPSLSALAGNSKLIDQRGTLSHQSLRIKKIQLISLLIALTSFGNFDLAVCSLKNQHNLASKGTQVTNSSFALSSPLRFIYMTLGENTPNPEENNPDGPAPSTATRRTLFPFREFFRELQSPPPQPFNMTSAPPSPVPNPLVGATVPPVLTAAPAPSLSNFTADQLARTFLSSQRNSTTRALVAPRVGGSTSAGAWTGLGAGNQGIAPESASCMRDFNTGEVKNFNAVSPVEEKCNASICPQLAAHRASSCGTHRVVTHSQHVLLSAWDQLCDQCCHLQQQRSLLRRARNHRQQTLVCASTMTCLSTSFDHCNRNMTFGSTRSCCCKQSHNKLCNWHADSSHRSIVHFSREGTAPRGLELNLSQMLHSFQLHSEAHNLHLQTTNSKGLWLLAQCILTSNHKSLCCKTIFYLNFIQP